MKGLGIFGVLRGGIEMYRIRRLAGFLSPAVLTGLLLSVVLASGAVAAGLQPTFDMNDRFATETGAHGTGQVVLTQSGEFVVKKINAAGLQSGHDYVLTVIISPGGGPPVAGDVRTSAVVTANPGGAVEFKNVNYGALAAGSYRVDLFVTHDHPTVAGTNPLLEAILGRDPLLACQPAVAMTME
jgi:hypothetical protein